jgi:exopolysaccharide biosynthesis polyprenyl glycosylphosphotransferase
VSYCLSRQVAGFVDLITRRELLAALAASVAALCQGSRGLVLPIGCAVFASAFLARPGEAPIAHLRVTRTLCPVLAPLLAVLAMLAIDAAVAATAMPVPGWLLVAAASGAATAVADSLRERAIAARRVRVAFVGSAAECARLADDLGVAYLRRFELVGRIAVGHDVSGRIPALGALGSLRAAIVDARIDLLVLGHGVPRLRVFEEFADSCLDLRVRIDDLPVLYEETFGQVPVSEINAAWFVQLADADARRPATWIKRGLDLVILGSIGILSMPLVAVLAYLVRLDGGPALYAQTRIGEHGRPFRIYKLRTMRSAQDEPAAWATDDDPRVTRLGRILRRTHLDELPQLWNIMRGEMSFVGPRPEQAPFVDHLERVLPFYQRRHLMRPGLTGWAQVRCGYAGSDAASALKLCNDLYYYKHRSLGIDLLVLCETAGQLLLGHWGGVSTVQSAGAGLPLAPVDTQPAPGELPAPDGVLDAA